MKLGQGDLVSFFMVLAIPGYGKLGQADLINSSVEDYLFGWNQTVLHSKGKLFPGLPGQSLHHSINEPELLGIENKGYPIRIHILVSMQRTLKPLESVIGQWDHSIP